ncbi:L-ornithine 5-monooxygenase (L-ornithine N(5)-oxygenase) [Alternaria alternata]|nr:L-ornithine 5-monooxygenase (L-ornithine N(5)-oxygenase) [Alternaria alternata]
MPVSTRSSTLREQTAHSTARPSSGQLRSSKTRAPTTASSASLSSSTSTKRSTYNAFVMATRLPRKRTGRTV